jgi:hypothetical protein
LGQAAVEDFACEQAAQRGQRRQRGLHRVARDAAVMDRAVQRVERGLRLQLRDVGHALAQCCES